MYIRNTHELYIYILTLKSLQKHEGGPMFTLNINSIALLGLFMKSITQKTKNIQQQYE